MAVRLYTPGPTADELAAIGLKPEDVVDDSVTEVWEENWISFQIFSRLRTQWRVGMAGPTGMDYTLLPMLFASFGVRQKKRAQILEDLQVMETEALHKMSEKD